jgi:hypothetical protein
MPMSPPSPCCHPFCPETTRQGFCEVHKLERQRVHHRRKEQEPRNTTTEVERTARQQPREGDLPDPTPPARKILHHCIST